jgi:hypothetical protein
MIVPFFSGEITIVGAKRNLDRWIEELDQRGSSDLTLNSKEISTIGSCRSSSTVDRSQDGDRKFWDSRTSPLRHYWRQGRGTKS